MAHQFRLENKIRKGRYFGFREGRSTTDAIAHVRALSDQSVSRGGVAIAVSFDIANAFNTLPWRIREALIYHRVPLPQAGGRGLSGRQNRLLCGAIRCGRPEGDTLRSPPGVGALTAPVRPQV